MLLLLTRGVSPLVDLRQIKIRNVWFFPRVGSPERNGKEVSAGTQSDAFDWKTDPTEYEHN
ncbi:MAG: hypothetical protein ACXW28_00260, partial [Thermoanaerobaculia bacterium]